MSLGGKAGSEQKLDAIKRIDISKIDPNPLAFRLDSSDVTELSLSLANQGQLSPIKVRRSPSHNDRYELVFGQRRMSAAKQLGWKQINAHVVSISDEEMVTYSLTENLERKDYSDYEQGLLIRKLHYDFHKSLSEIASSIGKSLAYVT